jgi:hypothetical protein
MGHGRLAASHALGRHDEYDGDVDLLVSDVSHEELAARLEARSLLFERGRLGGFSISPFPGVKVDCFSTQAFGPAVSIQESFEYFNATVNAAAFKFSSPDDFFAHPLFEKDTTSRLLRILPKGLQRQNEKDRAQSLAATLRLLLQDDLTLVLDASTRQLIRDLRGKAGFVKDCEEICRELMRMQRDHEAEIIRRWLD